MTTTLAIPMNPPADLKREIGDLGHATAETWNQARADVASAWERVHRSYSDLEAQRTTS